MKTTFRNFLALVPLTLGLLAAPAAQAGDAIIGGMIGGGAGAMIGQHVGGRDGAVIGGALGAATGVYIANDAPRYRSPPPPPAYAYGYGPRVIVAPPPQTVYYVPAGRGWRGHDYRHHHHHHDRHYDRHHDRHGRR